MKKGFSLVEMLIVVTVLVTLMGITFRLGSIGGPSSRRNNTVARLQRLENCLSGYYAAFGTYPPVKLHGSRNYRLSVSSHGIQNLDGEEENLNWSWANNPGSEEEARDWRKVEAACRAQPVDCRFPYPQGFNDYVNAIAQELQAGAANKASLDEERRKVFSAGFDDGVSNNRGRHSQNKDSTEWREVQLFKFGLMSYLLPRYLVMMNSHDDMYDDFSQWTGNNSLPADPLTGQTYNNWRSLREKATSVEDTDIAHVANIPSQAVCARWMPNLEGVCHCNHGVSVFGVNIRYGGESDLRADNYNLEVYSPGGYDEDSTSGQYVLDGITVKDGWENEFYYYSPAPYQSYVLWSAGPNGKTFPPWVSRKSLDSAANECVGIWIQDDIVSMSN
jgi:prepilin-type N-terminal cleavage/methylation domain-containing protein